VLAILALRQTRQEVKRQLKAQGVKVALMPMREISLRAEAYLAANRAALMEDAQAMVMESTELRALYEREQRKYAKAQPRSPSATNHLACAELTHESQRTKVSGIWGGTQSNKRRPPATDEGREKGR
jgi:hypothetical protein